ncbi:MAG: glutathione peroxidase [Anaerocolumna sp.]|jgi:glutathione peroxidase|nr:glutathione peroxidase [Anaerocolumna sp.]
MEFYDFNVTDKKGNTINLDQYKGKVLLVVNTATQCGLTPQYTALEAVYEKYHNDGFEILDFPSNQFKEQAPGTDEEIDSFCQLNFGTTFPRFSKIDVNGDNTHPLYSWLKNEAPTDKGNDTSKAFEERVSKYTPDLKAADIRWNFGKFLIDKEGMVFNRYSPAVSPEEIEADIKQLLSE